MATVNNGVGNDAEVDYRQENDAVLLEELLEGDVPQAEDGTDDVAIDQAIMDPDGLGDKVSGTGEVSDNMVF